MILFLLCIGLLVFGIIAKIITRDREEWPIIPIVIGFASVFVSLIVIITAYSTAPRKVGALTNEYEFLTQQCESSVLDCGCIVANYSLIKDIQEWNSELLVKKTTQNNPWIGIYYPDIYDQFEFIALE